MSRQLLRVSIYINEGDQWRHRPLHLEVLQMLHDQGVAGGTVIRAVAGFTAKGHVETSSLADVGGKLPLVIEFIDSAVTVEKVMPQLMSMVGTRLVVQERVETLDG